MARWHERNGCIVQQPKSYIPRHCPQGITHLAIMARENIGVSSWSTSLSSAKRAYRVDPPQASISNSIMANLRRVWMLASQLTVATAFFHGPPRVVTSNPTTVSCLQRSQRNCLVPHQPHAPVSLVRRRLPFSLSLQANMDDNDGRPSDSERAHSASRSPRFQAGSVSELKRNLTFSSMGQRLASPAGMALAVSAIAACLAVTMLGPTPAIASVKEVVDATTAASAGGASGEHLHVGQKVANFFRRGGLPDWATLMAISAMPVVELRGGVPVGLWMGMPILKTFMLCVTGNMIPIPLILVALRSKLVQRLAKPVLDRAREKANDFGDEQSQALALTLFVGIPLPGTGAWTGAMGAFLLGMPFGKAMLSIFLGVVSAGLIMSCLTLAGKAGALLATAVLAAFCVSNIVSSGKEKP